MTTTPPRNNSGEAYTIVPSTVDMWSSLNRLTCIGAHEKAMIAEWKTAEPAKDDYDLIPLSTEEVKCFKQFICTKDNIYFMLHRKGIPRVSRYILKHYIKDIQAFMPALYARVMNENTVWGRIDSVDDAGTRDVYDLEVADAKVFAVNDGFIVWDTVNVHVPVSDNARREARQRMLPSRNLVGVAERKIMNKPEKEYMQGLYIATRMGEAPGGRAVIFRTLQEARDAYRSGAIDIDTPIQILDLNNKRGK